MKKITALFVSLMLILLCSCSEVTESSGEAGINDSSCTESVPKTMESGVWLSFSEVNAMLLSPAGFRAEFENFLVSCAAMKINSVYIHVRSYCDSLYPSSYFPLLEEAAGYDFDLLEYIVTACHSRGIRMHAWINPYRVSKGPTVGLLPENSPARKWLTDADAANDVNVCVTDGIYLNPAEDEVRQLIINGIREIIEKYDVDGIHFDDYFYPTQDAAFDAASYQSYLADAGNPLSLDDWRRANVNALVSGCYTAIKYHSKDITFSISPMASIERNYSELYADISAWLSGGIVDCIIPQLYFGFDYPDENFRFEKLMKDWVKLAKENKSVKLMIGLAPYKIGVTTNSDASEWCGSDDILQRQVSLCRQNSRVSGYVFFSATSLFSAEELNTRQREKLMEE